MEVVTYETLVAGLRALGLQPGMGVMVHSSLRSLGHVEGGAGTVIQALIDCLGPEGTLLMPSFNHGAAFEPGAPGYYDPLTTPTTNGAIPDHFWRLPGVHRSLNPTHAFAVWGRHALSWTVHHHRTLTMGPDSPLGLLWAAGGWGLLLGVDYQSNTFHHVVEMTTGAPCLGRRTEVYPIRLPDGRRVMGRTWSYRSRTCPFTRPQEYPADMAARGLHRQGTIGRSRVTLFRLQDCFEVYAPLLRWGRGDNPPCTGCPIRPWRRPEQVPSDWDAENETLLPGSEAWSY